MSIFVENSLLQLNSNVLEQLSCHQELPLCAVAIKEQLGKVYLFEHNRPLNDLPWTCPSQLLSIVWHPTEALIVLGSSSGELFCLSWEKKIQKEKKVMSTHKSPVPKLLWATENQLLSLDMVGILIFWNYSKDGYLIQISTVEIKDSPVGMALLTSSSGWECFVGSLSGTIYCVTQQNVLTEVAHLDKAVQEVICFEDSLCVLSSGGLVSVYKINEDDDTRALQLINTVKMSGKSSTVQVIGLSKCVLAITGGDLTIRLWDYDNNDTYVLPLPEVADISFHSGAEFFTCLAFQNAVLSATTNLGGIAFWRWGTKISNTEDNWQFIGFVSLSGGSILKSSWGQKSLFVLNSTTLYQIQQQQPCVVYKNQIGAVQLSSSAMSIQKEKHSVHLDVPFRISRLDLFDTHLLVCGENKIAIYHLGVTNSKPNSIGIFDCNYSLACLHRMACFCLEGSLIQMRSFQGSILATLSFLDVEGSPTLMNISGNFICAGSSSGFVKLWDISHRDPKLHVGTKHVTTSIPGFVKFQSLKTNCDGLFISFVVHNGKGPVDRLFIWRTSSNTIDPFNLPNESSNERIEDHFWDEDEPRMAALQVSGSATRTLIFLLVSSDDNSLLVQDTIPMHADHQLLGTHIPRYAVLDPSAHVQTLILESLVGLEEHNDKAARDALLSFGCHLRLGRVEEAYQAVRSFTSKSVWKSLAQSCVKLQHPDVGLICLGKLGNARAAQAVRLAQSKYAKVEAVTAVLAVQLGMLEEAEELCHKSSSFDLLNRMYQASNQWDKALQLATTKDRINLKRTFYDYARHLESEGNTQLAKEMYEKCQTHYYDVPRMLLDDSSALQEYCVSSDDPERLRWWAQFLESSGDMDSALEFYSKAKDYLSLVRLHCYLGNLDRATELADESQNAAACFHVARQHEANNNIEEALRFFGQAGAYGNAVRLCKEHELDDQLYRYALQGEPEEMIDAARYFESATSDRQPRFDRAVLLYSKAGLLDTALDLASRTEQHEAISELARRLDKNSNPASLQRCANYLAAHRHYDAAVDLLVMAGKFSEAIDMCLEYNVKLTEALADQLSAGSDSNSKLLTQLAEAAQRQGDYQLAAKKFTQAGNRFQAMKALLKSGDTERIIFFANVSRQTDIYILAGNYLQTLDWRSHPEYVKHIVTFYSKARSPDLLAGFYEACAQAEIDEYQNYESALNALKEAQKIMSKVVESHAPLRWQVLLRKIDFVEKFINVRELSNSNPSQGIIQLETILQSTDLDLGIIKIGNVYSSVFNIQFHHQLHNEAMHTLNRMKSSIPNFMQYLDRETVSTLCHFVGVSSDFYLNDEVQDTKSTGDEIMENIR